MRPSIDEVREIQNNLYLNDRHVVWLDPQGFVIAHTDVEREALPHLDQCPLHRWLEEDDEMPMPSGYYIVVPYEPDKYSEAFPLPAFEWKPLVIAAQV